MVKNYLKIAFRNLLKDKFYSLINILGLAIGIASCLLCYLHIRYELSYDTFHSKAERIYRVTTGDLNDPDSYAGMAAPMAPYLKGSFAEVVDYVRVARSTYDPKMVVKNEDNSFYESNFFLVDPSFFTIFDYPLVKGEKAEVLPDRNAVVISESAAKKYFGSSDPINKVIVFDDKYELRVTGVMKDFPPNSHLNFNFVAQFENIEKFFGEGSLDSWGQFNYFNYILLDEQANYKEVQKKAQDLNIQVNENSSFTTEFLNFQPLKDIHFQYNRGNQFQTYDKNYIYIFTVVAIAVLLIAVINFINLTIARSTNRIKEVGLRKTLGANRIQLVFQFIAESLLTTLFALAIGIILLELFKGELNNVMNNNVMIDYENLQFLMVLLSIAIIIGLLAGSYISFYVTAFVPAKVLKGDLKRESSNMGFRKLLLLFQLIISLILISGSLVIFNQLQFIKNKNLGLNDDLVINLPIYSNEVRDKINVLKTELNKSSLIVNSAASAFVPGQVNWHQSIWWEGKEEDLDDDAMFVLAIDKDFISTTQMNLIEGDIERIENLNDEEFTYILNEAALEMIGWETTVGKKISTSGPGMIRTVGGVVEDFNFKSLHHSVDPIVMTVGDRFDINQLSVRVKPDKLGESIEHMEDTFLKLFPGVPFEYSFMDESFGELYKSEKRAGKVISFFTGLSIIIALLGLYGLASFHMKERTKEIAIRKVLGISQKELVFLLTRNYMGLLLISVIISIPIAWLLMSSWLRNFTFHIELNISFFILAALALATVVVFTVSSKALVVGTMNPVNSLRSD